MELILLSTVATVTILLAELAALAAGRSSPVVASGAASTERPATVAELPAISRAGPAAADNDGAPLDRAA